MNWFTLVALVMLSTLGFLAPVGPTRVFLDGGSNKVGSLQLELESSIQRAGTPAGQRVGTLALELESSDQIRSNGLVGSLGLELESSQRNPYRQRKARRASPPAGTLRLRLE